MSVLTNISLSGLTTSSNDFLYTNEIDVGTSLTMEPGSVLNLQPNSVSDSALSTNVAFQNGINSFTATNEFTNTTTFKNNPIEANAGITCADRILITRPPGDTAILIQDTTSLNSNTLSVSGNVARYVQNGPSSGHSFFVRNAANVQSTVLSLTSNLVLFTTPNPIQWSGTDPVVSDSSGRLASTRFVQSKQTNFLSLTNTWSSRNIFSRTTPGAINLTCQDSINASECNFAVNNNQINISMPSKNDSKFIFNTLSPGGVSNDTFTINQTTSTLNCTNPLVQSATMPPSNDSSTNTPTTAWVQGAITTNNTSLLSSVNTWTALNTFSRTAGNMNLRLLDSTNNTTFTGAVGNNQINLIMSNNDSKIYFNTFTPAGVQTDTLLLNSTTTTLNCTNPLVQTATMPAVSDNSTKTPTTSWVQGVLTFNIGALLNANNSWGGTNTFTQQVNANNGIVLTLPSGQNAIQIIDATSLNSNTLSVNGVAARYIQNGVSSVHNFFVRDASNVQFTSASISKSLVNFNSDSITWTGTNPPVTDNTQKLVTTSFLTSKINNFLTLNNTWSGTNQFTNQVICERSGIDIPLFIGSSTTANYKGNHFVSSSAGSYNPIVSANEYVIFGYNTSALDLSTLTLTTHSSTGSGIKISNNLTKVFGQCELEQELKTSTTDPPGSQCLGQIITIQRFVFPVLNWNGSWTGTAPNVNLYSYTFDNSTADKRYGTYMVQFQLVYTNTTAQKDFIANINEVSATTELSPFMTVCGNTNVQNYGGTFYYSIFVTMTIQIYGTKTLYFNCKLGSTGGTGSFTNDSYVRFIRIA